ncbi:MAG: rRNA pseudouridine synthase [Ruminococcaceae bacterium]|nr:rRNA pseudouridine synthase [Oscillospiraceae bacterium]
MNLQRLDKIISSQFNMSRSIARKVIRYGRVTVGDSVVHDPAFSVDPENAEISFRGQALEFKEHIYILLNKPKGVLSASEDKKRQTVVDLVPEKLKRNGLFPVGRLDRDTTGLLIITDDGDFAHNVLSPKKEIFKTYKVTLDGNVTEDIIKSFSAGITLADGTACRPAKLKALEENIAEIKICEGRYHQIKRMFGTVGLGVNELERTALGGLKLPENLAFGDCRELSKEELECIFVN